ncbi:hypothetical protein C2G38_2192593 [Gigaspora rosea]|uniref:Uncharacterized protein n=1 Tax=Gigaspora rosea TaxID=44941 RepID=A0A397UYN2_9GLOM|nr:hypothetical protein C2G38_2192593 [Gigaspora rosea]
MSRGKAMVNEYREYFFAKVMLQKKTELKNVFKNTVNVIAQAEAYRAYITAPAVPTKSSRTDVQERCNDKVDEELIEASKEKNFNDDNYERDVPQLSDDYSEENEKPIIEDLSDDYSEENEKPIIKDQNNVISPFTISTANEMEVKLTCNDNDEESSSSLPNQELEDTETIPPIIVNKINEQDGDIMTDTKMMHKRYLRICWDLCDYSSQKDWFIKDYNVSDRFRKYQISNIDKLVAGETFNFASSSEAILSLHNIIFIDSTTMKKPLS